MKKAIFVGYNEDIHEYNFTKGDAYVIRSRYDSDYVLDDDGYMVSLSNTVYDFFIKDDDGSHDFAEEPASLKYLINGNLVTKGYFYELLGELNEADRLGVKVSSVKFEIKFE